MHFVHVEDFFHPDAGYQLNLLSRLQVREGYKVTVITGEIDKFPNFVTSFFGKDNIEERDRNFEDATGVKIIRHPMYIYYSGRAIFKPGLHKLIKQQKPDVLFIHNEDTVTGIKLLWSYKRMNIPYVLDCHMLEMASENRFREYFRLFYRKFVTPVILKNDIPLIRVVDTDFVEKHYSIPLKKTHLLSFGTDSDFYKPDNDVKKRFRSILNIDINDFVVVYAGKLDESKGGKFLADAIEAKINLSDRNIKFIVIGNVPKDEYGLSVEDTFKNSQNSILRFPTQPYSNLAKYYQIADIAIFPRQCSMSYFEVQSCGLPVVLEKNEINLDRVSNKKGLIFSQNSIIEIRNAIEKFGNMEKPDFDVYVENSRYNILRNYDFVTISKQFTTVMIDKYKRFHSSSLNSK